MDDRTKNTSTLGSKYTLQQHSYISELNGWDILLGRGSGPNVHEGNIRFRNHVATRKDEYINTKHRNNKSKIAMEVVQWVFDNNGRFVKKLEPEEAHELGLIPSTNASYNSSGVLGNGSPGIIDIMTPIPSFYELVDDETIMEKAKQSLRQLEKVRNRSGSSTAESTTSKSSTESNQQYTKLNRSTSDSSTIKDENKVNRTSFSFGNQRLLGNIDTSKDGPNETTFSRSASTTFPATPTESNHQESRRMTAPASMLRDVHELTKSHQLMESFNESAEDDYHEDGDLRLKSLGETNNFFASDLAQQDLDGRNTQRNVNAHEHAISSRQRNFTENISQFHDTFKNNNNSNWSSNAIFPTEISQLKSGYTDNQLPGTAMFRTSNWISSVSELQNSSFGQPTLQQQGSTCKDLLSYAQQVSLLQQTSQQQHLDHRNDVSSKNYQQHNQNHSQVLQQSSSVGNASIMGFEHNNSALGITKTSTGLDTLQIDDGILLSYVQSKYENRAIGNDQMNQHSRSEIQTSLSRSSGSNMLHQNASANTTEPQQVVVVQYPESQQNHEQHSLFSQTNESTKVISYLQQSVQHNTMSCAHLQIPEQVSISKQLQNTNTNKGSIINGLSDTALSSYGNDHRDQTNRRLSQTEQSSLLQQPVTDDILSFFMDSKTNSQNMKYQLDQQKQGEQSFKIQNTDQSPVVQTRYHKQYHSLLQQQQQLPTLPEALRESTDDMLDHVQGLDMDMRSKLRYNDGTDMLSAIEPSTGRRTSFQSTRRGSVSNRRGSTASRRESVQSRRESVHSRRESVHSRRSITSRLSCTHSITMDDLNYERPRRTSSSHDNNNLLVEDLLDTFSLMSTDNHSLYAPQRERIEQFRRMSMMTSGTMGTIEHLEYNDDMSFGSIESSLFSVQERSDDGDSDEDEIRPRGATHVVGLPMLGLAFDNSIRLDNSEKNTEDKGYRYSSSNNFSNLNGTSTTVTRVVSDLTSMEMETMWNSVTKLNKPEGSKDTNLRIAEGESMSSLMFSAQSWYGQPRNQVNTGPSNSHQQEDYDDDDDEDYANTDPNVLMAYLNTLRKL